MLNKREQRLKEKSEKKNRNAIVFNFFFLQ